MKIKFNWDDNLSVNAVLKLHMLTVFVGSVFEKMVNIIHKFLDECLYEVQMLEYNRIDISEGVGINKTNASKEYDICHYWYFLDKIFKYKPYICNVCHDLMLKAMNFNDVAIVSVKRINWRIHFWYMNKNDALDIMKNSNLNKKRGSL